MSGTESHREFKEAITGDALPLSKSLCDDAASAVPLTSTPGEVEEKDRPVPNLDETPGRPGHLPAAGSKSGDKQPHGGRATSANKPAGIVPRVKADAASSAEEKDGRAHMPFPMPMAGAGTRTLTALSWAQPH